MSRRGTDKKYILLAITQRNYFSREEREDSTSSTTVERPRSKFVNIPRLDLGPASSSLSASERLLRLLNLAVLGSDFALSVK
jgi:hypothetical protein